MDVTRVLLCYSGHTSSTFDISKYLHAGFLRTRTEIKPYRLDQELVFSVGACQKWQEGHPGYKMGDGDSVFLASRNLLSEIVTYRPSLVLIVTGTSLFGATWNWLRQLQSDMRKPFIIGLVLTESPYLAGDELQMASYANIVWTNDRAFVKRLRVIQPRSYWLPHAYDESVHYPSWNQEKTTDVYFCGTGQPGRFRLFGEMDWSGIKLRLEGYFPGLVERYPHLEPFYTEGIVNNADVSENYRSSAICLNVHRREAETLIFRAVSDKQQIVRKEPFLIERGDAHSLNDRAIGVAACGAFQLCDSSREELTEVFGDSVPTYSSSEELHDKIRYYLAHERERKALSVEAYRRVLGRTYTANAVRILDQVMDAF